MTRIERGRRIIFDAKLYRACGRLAGDFGNHAEPKIDAGGDTARGDYIAVTHDPCLLEFCAEERQQFVISPMRGGAPALQQPGNAEHEGAGANRGDVFGAGCLPAHEIDGLAIADRADDAFDAAGNADQVERRAARNAVGRQQTQSAVARHRLSDFAATTVRDCGKRASTCSGPVRSSWVRSGKRTKPTVKLDMIISASAPPPRPPVETSCQPPAISLG